MRAGFGFPRMTEAGSRRTTLRVAEASLGGLREFRAAEVRRIAQCGFTPAEPV